MLIRDRIAILDEALDELCRRYHAGELALFGSVLRDDFRDDSDIDVLVEFEPDARIGLLELAGLQGDLSDLLGRNVDLVTKSGLKPLIQEPVLRTAQTLYTVDEGVQMPVTLDAEQARAVTCINRDLLHLHTAVDACTGIAEITAGAEPLDDLHRSAMLYELTRLGEAIRHLSPALKQRYPDAPWELVRDTGARMIERYDAVDWEQVWNVASVAVPTLHDQIVVILAAEFPELEEEHS